MQDKKEVQNLREQYLREFLKEFLYERLRDYLEGAAVRETLAEELNGGPRVSAPPRFSGA